jgi:hypothetical protein
LLNSTPLSYNISGSTYTLQCIGPFARGTVLNFTVIAEDEAGKVAIEEFSLGVVEGEVKLESEGTLKEDGRSVKIELEAKWRKGEAKGEFELKEEIEVAEEEEGEEEKEEKKKFKAHGKIESLYRDCDGIFRIFGVAKVESGKGKDKVRENVVFSGWITEEEIRIAIDGREYVVPAKVKVKETSGGGED